MLTKWTSILKLRSNPLNNSFKIWRRPLGLSYYEPPYLEAMKPKLPVYEAVTLQIRGYDFPPLENFQKFAHTVAEFLEINVDECWAHPGRHYDVKKYQEGSSVVESSYKLIMYERDIKLTNVMAAQLPLYIELLQNAMPEGTKLDVFPFDVMHQNERYVPDHDLNAKQKELDELGGPPDEANDNPFFAPALLKKK